MRLTRSTARLRFSSAIGNIFLITTLSAAVTATPVFALNIASPASLGIKADDQASGNVIEVRGGRGGGGGHRGGGGHMHAGGGGGRVHAGGGGARVHAGGGARVHAGGAVVGRHGNVAVRNTAVVARRGAWARPGNYRWPRGGAIAAGAAIGFVTAATAAAWAGAPPASGMCWYYTDITQTQGFWDYCQ